MCLIMSSSGVLEIVMSCKSSDLNKPKSSSIVVFVISTSILYNVSFAFKILIPSFSGILIFFFKLTSTIFFV